MKRLTKKERELKEKAGAKHLTNTALKFYIEEAEREGKKERGIINKLKKEDAKIENFINQREVEEVRIEIEWKKSATWRSKSTRNCLC